MPDASWAPVVAALGASFLTIMGSFGLFQLQRWRDNRASGKAAKLAAYGELHARTFTYAQRAQAVGLLKQLRSGITEGLDVSLRHRKPVEIFELYEWLNADLGPIHDAYSKICVIGTQEAIDVATKVVAACGDLLDSAIATDEQRGYWARLFKGEVRTPEQMQTYEAAVRHLFEKREALAQLIRRETGHAPVVLPIEKAKREVQATSSEHEAQNPPAE